MTDRTKTTTPTPRRTWNYTPLLPLQVAPYWNWPMKPVASLIYLLRSWNPVGTRCLFLLGAIITWLFFTPELGRAETLSFGWVFEVWFRNFIILFSVAGGLHLLLWRLGVQGDEMRYDMRPMMKNTKVFWFKNQVRDNMFWSFIAMQFWTFWECFMWYAYANGWATMITFESNPIWFVMLIVLIPIWAGLYFYASSVL